MKLTKELIDRSKDLWERSNEADRARLLEAFVGSENWSKRETQIIREWYPGLIMYLPVVLGSVN